MTSWFPESFQSFADEQAQERMNQCLEIEQALLDCERISRKVHEGKGNNNGNGGLLSGVGVGGGGQKGGRMSSLSKMWKGRSKGGETTDTNTDTNIPVVTDADADEQRRYYVNGSRAGMKIARFYDWKLANPRAENALNAIRGEGGMRSLNDLKLSPGNGNGNGNGADTRVDFGNDVRIEELGNVHVDVDVNVDVHHGDVRYKNPTPSCSMEHHAVFGCRAMALGCASELVQLKKCFQKFGDTNPKYFAYEGNSNGNGGVDDVDGGTDCKLDMRKLGQCVDKNWKELDARTRNKKRNE